MCVKCRTTIPSFVIILRLESATAATISFDLLLFLSLFLVIAVRCDEREFPLARARVYLSSGWIFQSRRTSGFHNRASASLSSSSSTLTRPKLISYARERENFLLSLCAVVRAPTCVKSACFFSSFFLVPFKRVAFWKICIRCYC